MLRKYHGFIDCTKVIASGQIVIKNKIKATADSLLKAISQESIFLISSLNTIFHLPIIFGQSSP